MGEALVGAMVAAMRRANRDWAEAARPAQAHAAPMSDGSARCYLAHPQLRPTVYSPSGAASGGEEVAARKV